MNQAWRDPGFAVPNAEVYPHQWLWDSCFHAVIWASLGSERGLTEVGNALSRQAADGFVPHMIYWHDPDLHQAFWGRAGASTITQPPMYGHALAEQARRGFAVAPDLVARARAGLLHLGDRPATPAGLVPIFHPWESGCDDSPRWDGWFVDCGPGQPTSRADRKGELVAALDLGPDGHAVGSSQFAVGSIGFNALVAWNARELAVAFPQPDRTIEDLADRLTEAIGRRWRRDRWVDDHLVAGPGSRPELGASVRTADTMVALLVDPRPEGFEQLEDPAAFGAAFGPRGVHADEPTYQPDVYWRGPTWPQLGYLLVRAAERADHRPLARLLARRTIDGGRRAGLAEYWHPETGAGLGARPQTWTGLILPVGDCLPG